MMKLSVILLLVLVQATLPVGIYSGIEGDPSPLALENPITSSTYADLYIPDGICQDFSIMEHKNCFFRNCRILDQDFRQVAKTSGIDGRYYFDGKKFIERINFPMGYSGQNLIPPSLVTINDDNYYIPLNCQVYPLENLYCPMSTKELGFFRLDTGEKLSDFIVSGLRYSPDLFGNGKYAIINEVSSIRLVDVTNGLVLSIGSSPCTYDAGNGVFVTPSTIYDTRKGVGFSLSDFGFNRMQRFRIKQDWVEFYKDCKPEVYPSQMYENPMMVRIGFDGVIKEKKPLDFVRSVDNYRVVNTFGSIVVVGYFKYSDSSTYRLEAFDDGQSLWKMDFGSESGESLYEVHVVGFDQPRLLFRTHKEIFCVDLLSGKVEKRFGCKELPIMTDIVSEEGCFYFAHLDPDFSPSNPTVFKMGMDGKKVPIEIPFKLSRPLIDSDNGQVYVVERQEIAEPKALLVKAATIDAKTGTSTQVQSVVLENADATAVSLDGRFLFIYGPIIQKIIDLSNGKTKILANATSISCTKFDGVVCEGRIYALSCFGQYRNVLNVFNDQFDPISQTFNISDAIGIMRANGDHVLLGKKTGGFIMSDCNGDWRQIKGVFKSLEKDALYYTSNRDASMVRFDLATEMTENLGTKYFSINPIRELLGQVRFDGRNMFDNDFNWLQYGMDVSKLYKIGEITYANVRKYADVIYELKPAPCYKLSRTGVGTFTITNSRTDGLADDLTGYATVFTTPDLNIDKPEKLGQKKEFSNLLPGQSVTVEFDTTGFGAGDTVHLAVFSNGFYDKKNTNPEKDKYAYVGTYLDDTKPFLVYIGSWILKK
jgi:hypothetical protein